MNKYYDLETSILCCFMLKPELMETTKLEDKHFIKNQRMWQFMKSFYKKFGTFDITLMASVIDDKYKLMRYIVDIFNTEPTPFMFEKYEKQLIDLYNEDKKEKWIIHKIQQQADNLWVRNINSQEFLLKVNEIINNANEIFK